MKRQSTNDSDENKKKKKDLRDPGPCWVGEAEVAELISARLTWPAGLRGAVGRRPIQETQACETATGGIARTARELFFFFFLFLLWHVALFSFSSGSRTGGNVCGWGRTRLGVVGWARFMGGDGRERRRGMADMLTGICATANEC